mmetsp:Transcript_24836/g.40270  ORF Transcript_24836/g.40270 Transcript_24836/m.40270 type:complete len:489 (-) Transcript_24836:6225-7691(-)
MSFVFKQPMVRRSTLVKQNELRDSFMGEGYDQKSDLWTALKHGLHSLCVMMPLFVVVAVFIGVAFIAQSLIIGLPYRVALSICTAVTFFMPALWATGFLDSIHWKRISAAVFLNISLFIALQNLIMFVVDRWFAHSYIGTWIFTSLNAVIVYWVFWAIIFWESKVSRKFLVLLCFSIGVIASINFNLTFGYFTATFFVRSADPVVEFVSTSIAYPLAVNLCGRILVVDFVTHVITQLIDNASIVVVTKFLVQYVKFACNISGQLVLFLFPNRAAFATATLLASASEIAGLVFNMKLTESKFLNNLLNSTKKVAPLPRSSFLNSGDCDSSIPKTEDDIAKSEQMSVFTGWWAAKMQEGDARVICYYLNDQCAAKMVCAVTCCLGLGFYKLRGPHNQYHTLEEIILRSCLMFLFEILEDVARMFTLYRISNLNLTHVKPKVIGLWETISITCQVLCVCHLLFVGEQMALDAGYVYHTNITNSTRESYSLW